MPRSRNKTDVGSELPTESLPRSVIEERYKGQWVLVKITAVDELHSMTEGSVLAYGAHDHVHKRLSEIYTPGERLNFPYFVFVAGRLVPIGSDVPRQSKSTPLEGRTGAG
jgi:hypothetical protein